MNEIELLENLLGTASKISYENKDEFSVLERRTEMIIRKLFGDDSHYLKDLKNIRYSPMLIVGGNTNWKKYFEDGLKEFRNLISVLVEDKKLSSNYDDSSATNFIQSEDLSEPKNKEIKEIKILIASPGGCCSGKGIIIR